MSGFVSVIGPDSAFSSSATRSASASCPSGKSVIAGGYELRAQGGNTSKLNVVKEMPIGTTGWSVMAREIGPFPKKWALKVGLVCADAG